VGTARRISQHLDRRDKLGRPGTPQHVSKLYIGLISGTSVDSIDAVLARFDAASFELIATHAHSWEADLSMRLDALIRSAAPTWHEFGTLHIETGRAFAQAALTLLERAGVPATDVCAIGHHGQTVHHAPDGAEPFTIQIGDPNTVAARTGITTVADLRGYDMAVGGQGAPLVPAFHDWLLRSETEHRVVLNIGGIANITTLSPAAPILGCDTGPGNTLLDIWIHRHHSQRFDDHGRWSAQGHICEPLLQTLLAERWLDRPAPKSTGRELFNADWLDAKIEQSAARPTPVDVQTTLAEFTALSIIKCIDRTAPQCQRIIVCGGGVFNDHLMTRLRSHSGAIVESSAQHDLDPQWVEALAFAWLAQARLAGIPGNVPSVTGAHQPAILGSIYSGVSQ